MHQAEPGLSLPELGGKGGTALRDDTSPTPAPALATASAAGLWGEDDEKKTRGCRVVISPVQPWKPFGYHTYIYTFRF